MANEEKAPAAAEAVDPQIEEITKILTKHNCRVDGMLVINESVVRGVPEVKPLMQMGESEEELSKRVNACSEEIDAWMQKEKKAWRITAAVLNGASRLQIDLVDASEESQAEEVNNETKDDKSKKAGK